MEIRRSREKAEFVTTIVAVAVVVAVVLVVVFVGIIVIVFPPAQNVVQDEGFLPPCRELKAPVLPAMIRSSSGLNKTLEESGIFPILLSTGACATRAPS